MIGRKDKDYPWRHTGFRKNPSEVRPGVCPRIAILFKIEEYLKKQPQAYSSYSEDYFFEYEEEVGQKDILGQPPSKRLARDVIS
jgi:hypothetical protein